MECYLRIDKAQPKDLKNTFLYVSGHLVHSNLAACPIATNSAKICSFALKAVVACVHKQASIASRSLGSRT